jgi:hypothetical protein
MATYLSIKSQICCGGETVDSIVDDRFSAITTGNTYYFTQEGKRFCATVMTAGSTTELPTATFTGNYTSCEGCLSGITNAVQITDCNSDFQSTYFVNLSTFTSLPSIGSVYLITLTGIDGDLKPNCFTIDCYVTTSEGTKTFDLVSISDSYTGCSECILNNTQTYQVDTCLDDPMSPYYVNLPLGFDYTGYLINFTNDIGESICGTASQLLLSTTPTGNLISILGLSSDYGGDVTCDDCLTVSNERRILTNCLDGTEQVVWGSTFFEGSEVTNLSSSLGCFEVGDLTESAVTITTYLDYNPQPDCQECIQCNGVDYYYSSCTETGPIADISYDAGLGLLDGEYFYLTGTTDGNGVGAIFNVVVDSGSILNIGFGFGIGYQVGDTISISSPPFGGSDPFVITVTDVTLTGIVRSYQYVNNSVGKTFFVPQLNSCVEITLVANPSDALPNYYLYSFDVFDNCELCEGNEFYVWKTQDCATNSNYIVTIQSNSFTTGDYVKVKWGTTDYQCHQLLSPYDFVTDGNLSSYKSETSTPFDNCESCNSDTLIGASIIKCGGGGQQFVNIPINIWNIMSTVLDGQLVFVTGQYSQCYVLLSNCPLEPNYNTITPALTYYNCLDCNFYNTRFPRSANTETLICVVCCDCGSTGSTITQVAPPHPVYTDGYGTEVTQMNMVVLGGIKGLNN